METTFFLCSLFVGALLVHAGLADLVPRHVYLSLTGDDDSMQVTFTTSSLPTSPFVQYWASTNPKEPTSIYGQPANTFTFVNPANSTAIDYITSFTLVNLTRATSYSYVVYGDAKNQTGTASGTFSFKSLPEDDSVINIGFFGDLGSNGTALLQNGPGSLAAYAHNFDFIVHNGDLAYNLGSDNGMNGNQFLSKIEDITSVTPYVVTPGNHEFKDATDPVYYNNWFWGQTLLGTRSNSTSPIMWYSYDVSPKLHIIAISTEVYCEDTGNLVNQYNWLVKDLEKVSQRPDKPWVVVFGHRQMYYGYWSSFHSRLMRLGVQCTDATLQNCDLQSPCDSEKNCGYSVEGLLHKYSVDLFLSGHMHTYVRMYPIDTDHHYEKQNLNLYLNPQSPVYVISGAPGIQSDTNQLKVRSAEAFNPVAVTGTGYSYSHMQVFNTTHMLIQQIDVATADVTDYIWIVKDSTHPPWSDVEIFALLPTFEKNCD